MIPGEGQNDLFDHVKLHERVGEEAFEVYDAEDWAVSSPRVGRHDRQQQREEAAPDRPPSHDNWPVSLDPVTRRAVSPGPNYRGSAADQ
jgi:hypothetical protein